MILVRYSRAASIEEKSAIGDGRYVGREKSRPISTEKVPRGEERGGGSGILPKGDWKVIVAVHIVETRPEKVKNDRCRAEGEVST